MPRRSAQRATIRVDEPAELQGHPQPRHRLVRGQPVMHRGAPYSLRLVPNPEVGEQRRRRPRRTDLVLLGKRPHRRRTCSPRDHLHREYGKTTFPTTPGNAYLQLIHPPSPGPATHIAHTPAGTTTSSSAPPGAVNSSIATRRSTEKADAAAEGMRSRSISDRASSYSLAVRCQARTTASWRADRAARWPANAASNRAKTASSSSEMVANAHTGRPNGQPPPPGGYKFLTSLLSRE
jgi:hypothetical protein